MTAAEKRCRVLWQQVVALRDGKCLRCGHVCPEDGELQNVGHHVFGRGNRATCFEPDAGISLCPTCHNWARLYPEMSRELLWSLVGDERYTELAFLSKSVCRLKEADFKAIEEGLRKQLEGL